jgi:hypothetical protein
VRAGLAAHAVGDWQELVSLIDGASLESWRNDFVQANTHIRSVEEWRAELPDAPTPALEKLAEQMAVPIRGFVERLPMYIDGVQSLAELAGLSSAEVLVRVLKAKDQVEGLNRMVAAAYAAAGMPRPENTYYQRPNRRFTVLEQHPATPYRVLVTVRGDEIDTEDTWATTWHDGRGWCLVMSAELLDLPGGSVTYIDDSVVLEFLRRQSQA